MKYGMNLHKSVNRLLLGAVLIFGPNSASRADVPAADGRTQIQTLANGDWPQWRGPKRDNLSTETGLLKEWPKGGPPLVWEAKGLNDGFSSVSVANGQIYTIGSKNNTTSIICMDMAGKQLWTTPFGSGSVGGGNKPGPRSSPTVDGDLVFAMDEMGTLACFQIADGKRVWSTSLSKNLGGRIATWGFAESPVVDGDVLVCTPGGSQGTVAGLDKKTGKELWRSKGLTDQASYASLVPAEIGGTHQYVVLTPGHVAGIAPGGKVLWQANRRGQTAIIPTPIVHDDLVFVTSGYNVGCNCFQVTGSGQSFEAKEIYSNKDLIVHHGDVVQVDGYVYGITDTQRGLLVCMEMKTGKVIWKDKSIWKDGNYGVKGTVSYADGRLYIRSAEGGDQGATSAIALVEATPTGYHELGRFEQPDRSNRASWSHPVISNGKLFLRDQDVLLCYDIKAK